MSEAQVWKPGAAGHECVRQQERYDQTRTEEHPGVAESDEEDDEESSVVTASKETAGSVVSMETTDTMAAVSKEAVAGGEDSTSGKNAAAVDSNIAEQMETTDSMST
jgi:hypothetical protein